MRALSIPSHFREDLISAGYLGLVQAAGRFDSANEVEFRTFSYHRIRGAIIDALRELSDLSPKAYRYARGLKAALAVRDAVFTGEDPASGREGLAEVFEFAAQGALAFRLSLNDAWEEVEALADESDTAEVRLEIRADNDRLRVLIGQLPEYERFVITRYYLDGLSFAEIADERFNSSRSWVSKIHSRGLRRLRETMERDVGQEGQ